MKNNYVLISTKGEYQIVQIEKEQFLNKCYELINCEIIEIRVPNVFGNSLRFIIDESGMLNEQKYNPLATTLYNRPDILFGNVIVGKVGINQYGKPDVVELTDEECNCLITVLTDISKELCVCGLL